MAKIKAFPVFTWDSGGFRDAHVMPMWARSSQLRDCVEGLVMYLVDKHGTSEVRFDAYRAARRR